MPNDFLIYFFVGRDGQIHINHLNNTVEELVKSFGYREKYHLLLFAYCYTSRKLYVTNFDDEKLLDTLEELKKYNSGVSSSESKDIVLQFKKVSEFLKKQYAWKGEILSGDSLISSVVNKKISDFDFVWKYLKLLFGSIRLDPIDLPVYIVDKLDQHSLFIPSNQYFSIKNEDIIGPAIILRKNNSLYFLSEAIIYQYVLNLHGIIDFSPKTEETYLRDAKEFVDETLISFLRNNNLVSRTFWYLGKKDGKIYLNRNEYARNALKLMEDEGYGIVITFEYVSVEDSRYIIFNNITAEAINEANFYKEMLQFLIDNVVSIGHTDLKGAVIKKPPLFLFEGEKAGRKFLSVSNLPIWIVIKTILSVIYDFDPKDIPIIKGIFDESFVFRYIDLENDEDKKIFEKYFHIDGDEGPVILWNALSYDSLSGSWNQFIKEYLRFIGKNILNDSGSIKNELLNFKEKILKSAENRLLLEYIIGLQCEEDPYYHKYNIFNVFTKVVGLTGIITEDMFEKDKHFNDTQSELLSDMQSSLFFLTLKSMANFANIKHGIDFYIDGEINKGDVVVDLDCRCIFEVEAVMLESERKTSDNPDGIIYRCKNLICGDIENKAYGQVKIFHLGFLDEIEYNEKQASVLKKEAQQLGVEYYKSILEQFIRNKKRPNPLDYTEQEDADPPSFEASLNMQRKEFNRTEGDAVLENMLNNCRKVKTYGN